MNTMEQLRKYPYFGERLKDTAPEALPDDLAEPASRGHIPRHAQRLTDRGTVK